MEHTSKIRQKYRCLRGKSVYLRPPKYEELESVKSLGVDNGIKIKVGDLTSLLDQRAEKRFRKIDSSRSETDYYLIFDLEDSIVGAVSFQLYDVETKTWNLTVIIKNVHRSESYTKEALTLLLGYYFFEFGGQVIESSVLLDDTEGQELLLQIGFEHNSLLEEAFLVGLTKEKFRELYNEDEYFLRLAINLANQARQIGEDPFGAVLVYDGMIMHKSVDKTIQSSDPTAHAEVNVIREYCQLNKDFSLEGFTIYSSTEPCLMCSGAIHWAKISKVVFSVSQEMLSQFSGGRPKPKCNELLNIGRRKVEVIGPLLPEEGLAVYKGYEFIPKAKRHKLHFANMEGK